MPKRTIARLDRCLNRSAAPLASRREVTAGRRDVSVTREIPNRLDIGSSDEEAGAERVSEAVKRAVVGRHAGSLEEFPVHLVSPRLH